MLRNKSRGVSKVFICEIGIYSIVVASLAVHIAQLAGSLTDNLTSTDSNRGVMS